METLFNIAFLSIAILFVLTLFGTVLFGAVAEYSHENADPSYSSKDGGKALVYEMGFSVLFLAVIAAGADFVSAAIPNANVYMVGAGVYVSYALSFYFLHRLCIKMGSLFPNTHKCFLYN